MNRPLRAIRGYVVQVCKENIKTWNVRISMDGKGRFKDNIFIERLWRTLKYERIYLNTYETGAKT